jgi:hypothetical protein
MAMMTVSYLLLLVLMMVMMITQGFQGSLRRSPIQFNIRSVENYDNVVAQYDKMLSLDEELAHIFLKMILKSKDDAIKFKDETITEVIKSKDETITQIEKKVDAITHSKDEIIESNKSLLKEKDIRLKEKENQILGLKGLLSSRGIFENYLDFCLSELQLAKLASPSQKFIATYIIDIMAKFKHDLPKDGVCIKILNAAAACNADLKSVSSTLSRDIHGAPWNGNGGMGSLKVYLNEMNQCEQCIVYFIAESMLLKIQETE